MSKALAKAKLITEGLRAAAQANISAQAQALFAILIAESWPSGKTWVATITLAKLGERLGASRSSIKRWADELEHTELVRRQPGRMHVATRWTVLVGVHQRTGEGSPVNPPGFTSDAQEGSPVDPFQDTGKEQPRPTPTSNPAGSSSVTEQEKIELLEQHAAKGNELAIATLRKLRRAREPTQQSNADRQRRLLELSNLVNDQAQPNTNTIEEQSRGHTTTALAQRHHA